MSDLRRLERFYDAVPRDRAVVEAHGGLVLFVASAPGLPFYARPAPGAAALPTLTEVQAVRARQRGLGVPEAFEWIDDLVPGLDRIAEAAGLAVLRAPLMVLDVAPPRSGHAQVRMLDPDAPGFADQLAASRAVAWVGFGAPGTAIGEAGTAARDRILGVMSADAVAREAARIRSGCAAIAVAGVGSAEGIVASGMYQRVDDVTEIVGVATLPVARRRGLGGAITAALAAHALAAGTELVFITAGSDEVAAVYARAGFVRVATACVAEPAA